MAEDLLGVSWEGRWEAQESSMSLTWGPQYKFNVMFLCSSEMSRGLGFRVLGFRVLGTRNPHSPSLNPKS